MKSVDLFCLPFAGGNKYSYRMFGEYLPPFVNLIPLEYPGRGGRIKESLLTDMSDVVDDMFTSITQRIGQNDYALFGHSMGGLVSSLVARKIVANNLKSPIHIIVSGTEGPSAHAGSEKKRHLLNKSDFINAIRDLEGSPEEVLQNDSILEFLEPILRADFTATENYIYQPGPPLDIDLTVLTGIDEHMEESDINRWQMETKRKVDFKRLPGGHFFLFNYPRQILEMISKKIYFI